MVNLLPLNRGRAAGADRSPPWDIQGFAADELLHPIGGLVKNHIAGGRYDFIAARDVDRQFRNCGFTLRNFVLEVIGGGLLLVLQFPYLLMKLGLIASKLQNLDIGKLALHVLYVNVFHFYLS